MKILILFLTFLPTLFEAFFDRYGESKKGKVKDTLWLLIAAASLMALSLWLFDIHPLWTGLLILVWRVCTFDYWVNWFLKRYSKGHKNINIWTYSGTTAFTDRIVSKVHPILRLVLRTSLFAVALRWYLGVVF